MKKITAVRNKEIFDSYNNLIKEGKDFKEALGILSKNNDIGKSYIHNILKKYGVVDTCVTKRDARIIEMYMQGDDNTVIAKEHGLTTTRIGQIIRGRLGKYAKSGILEKSLVELKDDINGGMDHKAVQEKYGASLLRKIKSNLGYNAFDACIAKRNNDILAMYKRKIKPLSAAEIADVFGLTRDHVYGILHEFGERTKPTRAEYRKRNEKIAKDFKNGKTSKELAAEYDRTVTNINIILNKMEAR